MLAAVAALCLGGCATYTGGTADDSATVQGWGPTYGGSWGANYDYGGAFPVYRQPSPNGQDMPMGGARPDVIFYR